MISRRPCPPAFCAPNPLPPVGTRRYGRRIHPLPSLPLPRYGPSTAPHRTYDSLRGYSQVVIVGTYPSTLSSCPALASHPYRRPGKTGKKEQPTGPMIAFAGSAARLDLAPLPLISTEPSLRFWVRLLTIICLPCCMWAGLCFRARSQARGSSFAPHSRPLLARAGIVPLCLPSSSFRVAR